MRGDLNRKLTGTKPLESRNTEQQQHATYVQHKYPASRGVNQLNSSVIRYAGVKPHKTVSKPLINVPPGQTSTPGEG